MPRGKLWPCVRPHGRVTTVKGETCVGYKACRKYGGDVASPSCLAMRHRER